MPAWRTSLYPDRACFQKRSRLIGKGDFQDVFRRPEKSLDPYFTVLARANELGFPRLGLAISRKSAKSAVVRNRIKRVIRESFRQHQKTLGSVDVVVIGRAGVGQWNNAMLWVSLGRHWTRLARRCARS